MTVSPPPPEGAGVGLLWRWRWGLEEQVCSSRRGGALPRPAPTGSPTGAGTGSRATPGPPGSSTPPVHPPPHPRTPTASQPRLHPCSVGDLQTRRGAGGGAEGLQQPQRPLGTGSPRPPSPGKGLVGRDGAVAASHPGPATLAPGLPRGGKGLRANSPGNSLATGSPLPALPGHPSPGPRSPPGQLSAMRGCPALASEGANAGLLGAKSRGFGCCILPGAQLLPAAALPAGCGQERAPSPGSAAGAPADPGNAGGDFAP